MAIITTLEALRAVVAEYSAYDEFVVDLESVYHATPEELERQARVRAIPAKKRAVDDAKWLDIFELKATDPLANEINWIGLAGPGGSSVSIPVGHPKGRQLKADRKIKMRKCDVFPNGDPRGLTKSGAPSSAAILVHFPAEFAPPPAQLPIEVVIEHLRPLFFDETKLVIGQNVKFDIKTLVKYFGGDWPTARIMDIILCQHLLNERLKDYGLEKLSARHFNTTYDKLGKKGVHNFSYGKAARYVVQDCRYEWLLWRKFKNRIQRIPSLWLFLNDYLVPFYEAIMRMEYEGIEVDTRAVAELRVEKEKEIARILDKLIVDYYAPVDFNPNAEVQIRQLVFDKYKGKATKLTAITQEPSTDAESLQAVAESMKKFKSKSTGEVRLEKHPAAPVAQLILDWKEQNKVLSTYLVGIPNRLDRRQRVHADYLLYGTETSRLSCREPNIQNIPRESEMRGMFRAPKGYVLVIGDYDQIELRKIAVESGDPALMHLFNSGQDVHRGTAAMVLNQDFSDTDDEERQIYGKMPNFLVGYGGGASNLADKTGIAEDHAQKVIDLWYRRFNRIQPWKARVIREAKARATFSADRRMLTPPYVETMLGRRRRLPELWWDDNKARMRAERQAVNTIVQGGASETALLGLVAVVDHYKRTGFPMMPVIEVHDEIVCTVPERHADEAKVLLGELMGGVKVPHTGELPLKGLVPLAAKVVVGERWLK